MKRYLVFAGHNPPRSPRSGGMHDLKGSFDSSDEAYAELYRDLYDWHEVYDQQKEKFLAWNHI